jgi:predicted DNA-binding transcriptional regulator YafY
MPARTREQLGATRGRVHVDGRRWMGVSPPSAALATLREAVWNDRWATIAYTDRVGKVTRRTLEPFGLVTKAGIWYLIARDRGTVKTFRVQRVARARMLERRFVRPSTFDAGEYWKGVAAHVAREDEPYLATFRMTRRGLANASLYCKVESQARVRNARGAEWIVRIKFPMFEAALHEAISWQEDGIVIEPPELCKRIHDHATALANLYAERMTAPSRA